MLNFVLKELYVSEVKATAYSTSIWPTLEYVTVKWDPCQYLIKRAARWAKQQYDKTSVTSILNSLKWSIV